jgi:hypothetical protein
LTTDAVAAVDVFARVRGGTVVLLADRRPSGRYVSLLGGGPFQEVLVEKPVTLAAADGTRLRASELTYPRALPVGAEPLLSLPHRGVSRAVVLAVPRGHGRVLVSGALDAWRYRADDGGGFERFWRSTIGREALAASRRIELTLEPGTAVAGGEVVIRAAVRPTAFERVPGGVSIPAVAADVIDAQGESVPVRLWPGAERGLFEGRFRPAGAGRFVARVRSDDGATAESPLTVAADASAGRPHGPPTAAVVASGTGGAVVRSSDLGPLEDALRALPRAAVVVPWHPMRSGWWAVAFTSLLCAEWALRRRSGLR